MKKPTRKKVTEKNCDNWKPKPEAIETGAILEIELPIKTHFGAIMKLRNFNKLNMKPGETKRFIITPKEG